MLGKKKQNHMNTIEIEKELLILRGLLYALDNLTKGASGSYAHKTNDKWKMVDFSEMYAYINQKIGELEEQNTN